MTDQANRTKDIVLSYLNALKSKDYEGAIKHLTAHVRIRGPAGENIQSPKDFAEMLRKFKGRYDIKKVFVDENDACALYDFTTDKVTVYMSSWYHVESGKIDSIITVFDPGAFGAQSE